jgi:hypothetical protein
MTGSLITLTGIAEVSEKFDLSQNTLRKQLITRMEDMKKTLERLDYKITRYEQTVVEKEKILRRTGD